MLASRPHEATAVTPQDRAFYQAMGQHIAWLRKAQGLTQVELAERLGVAQQTLAHYEVGRLRVALSMLPALASALTVSIEELLGETLARGNAKRGPVPRLQQQLEQITRLPRAKQRFVMQMLDTVLQQSG